MELYISDHYVLRIVPHLGSAMLLTLNADVMQHLSRSIQPADLLITASGTWRVEETSSSHYGIQCVVQRA